MEKAVAEQARDWVLQLASGGIDAEALVSLRCWLARDAAHARAFERERAFWQDMEPHRALFDGRAPTAASAKAPRPIRRKWALRSFRPARLTTAAAVAAMLLLALSGPGLLMRLRADHMTGTGQISRIALPDGSLAVLDSESAIRTDFGQSERGVTLLRGRAWFQVVHGDARPFRVAAAGGVTEDVGTAFEVDEIEHGQVHVAVSEGAVRVRGEGVKDVGLRAGERLRYGGQQMTMTKLPSLDPGRIASWRNGELLIDAMPVKQAIEAIGRYRSGAAFVLADLSGHPPVSGIFRTDRSDDALAAIASNAGLSITYLPAGVLLIH